MLLPLASSIAIKQPRHSLPSLLPFQIPRLLAIGRNPRHKVLPLGPQCVTSLGCPLPPDPYYPGGGSGHLHKQGRPLGMTSLGSPAGSGGDELELPLEEVFAPDELPTPCTRLDASTTGSREEFAPRETKRRRLTTTKCSHSTTSHGNREIIGSRVMPHGRYVLWRQ